MTRHLVSTSPAPRAGPSSAGARLACRVRLADGRVFEGELAPERHRAIQLGLLHADSDGFVELTPGTRAEDGTLAVDRRGRPEHFLAGGAAGNPNWLAALLAHADRIVSGAYARRSRGDTLREEAFVGVAPRTQRRGSKHAVAATRFLWLDVDRPDRLDALWSLLAQRPCHLLIESGGSGGVHAYWQLERPLPALEAVRDGAMVEPIERAHERLIHALGVDADGRPDVADPRCAERSRVMRLAGTVNHKSGTWARVIQADLALEPYTIEGLVGDLPDPPSTASRPRGRGGDEAAADPYKRIAPPEYFLRLAGISVPGGGLVRCPVPAHDDAHASCSVGAHAEDGWCCHAASCGARGAIYDLASVLIGGPWGTALRGDAFARARSHVVEAFGSAATKGQLPAAGSPRAVAEPAPPPPVVELWHVHVHDDVDTRIAGHDGSDYTSPPHQRGAALALVELLLGGAVADDESTGRWTHPIAGGRRTVRLERLR